MSLVDVAGKLRRPRRSGILLVLAATAAGAETSPREVEFQKLIPHVTDACAVVKTTPGIFPYRSFPFGPLGLEIRRAASSEDADQLRNFHLGVVAHACDIAPEHVTAHFFCGPQCVSSRKAHLAAQESKMRALAADFEKLTPLRLVAVWAPKGEMRVNDVFLLSGTAREALPSPVMGFVPSGEWKSWPGLAAYLATLEVSEDRVLALTDQMLAIGLSALVRESASIRLVGVGIGDNESGVILTRPGTPAPKVESTLPDHKTLSIVEKIGPDLYYYETN
jgi:hypothetical protein